jgi:hypothetical protein
MTRKDYVTLAKSLHNAKPGGDPDYASPMSDAAYTAWLAAVCGVSDALTKDNARFDSDRFIKACADGIR